MPHPLKRAACFAVLTAIAVLLILGGGGAGAGEASKERARRFHDFERSRAAAAARPRHPSAPVAAEPACAAAPPHRRDLRPLYGAPQTDVPPAEEGSGGGGGRAWRYAGVTNNTRRRELVAEAIKAAYGAYREHAFGADEVRVRVRGGSFERPLRYEAESWGGDAENRQMLQLVDALDTLHLAGLDAEFDEAVAHVARSFRFRPSQPASVFETTIRVVGGLLSAHALSGRAVLLEKAAEVADALSAAYAGDGSNRTAAARGEDGPPPPPPQRPPRRLFLPGRGVEGSDAQRMNAAEAGSVQLEHARLSRATGDARHYAATRPLLELLHAHRVGGARSVRSPAHHPFVPPGRLRELPETGLVPAAWDGDGYAGMVTTGGGADSFYEYLLKLWVVHAGSGGGKDKEAVEKDQEEACTFQQRYLQAADSIVEYLLVEQPPDMAVLRSGELRAVMGVGRGRGAAKTPGWTVAHATGTFEHLSCFVPGMLAEGAARTPSEEQARRHLAAAKKLAKLCAALYEGSPTGLAPDEVAYETVSEQSAGTSADLRGGAARSSAALRLRPVDKRGQLRPEAVESFFYLYRATKDEAYREWGWRVFAAMDQHARVCKDCAVSAFSAVWDTTGGDGGGGGGGPTGAMPTWVVAETLKYLLLLFSEDEVLDLRCWVFNTEAHPFPIPGCDGSRSEQA